MVEEESKSQRSLEQRAKDIFESVFKEAFLSSPGGLNLEACQHALHSLLDGQVSAELKSDVEEFFYQADDNNDGKLSRAEILTFIQKSLERGRFQRLFEAEDAAMLKLVEQVFDSIFKEAFDGEDEIETLAFYDCIDDNIGEDGFA